MSKVSVVYWSQSGNTQAMAEAVGKGSADAGAEVQEEVTFEANCTNDAKDYLCERFGASRTKLRTRAACDEFAKAHGVKIVYKD